MRHDHEELLKADLLQGAHFVLMLIPVLKEIFNKDDSGLSLITYVQDKNNNKKKWHKGTNMKAKSTKKWCFHPASGCKLVCVTWTYAPFIKECINYLLSDGVVGQSWDAV